MPPNTVYVGRPSKWGNPFTVGIRGVKDRADATVMFKQYIGCLVLWALSSTSEPVSRDDAQRELKGKNLACWCPVGQPCHADVLLKIANG